MSFKIVTVGWNCADFIDRTLVSIESQTNQDFEVKIVDDATEDPRQAQIIREWCEPRARWSYAINPVRQYAVRTQVEAIRALSPGDDDIIVWLDLDGDQFAHPDVLNRLVEEYADGTLLTYGSYRPIPDLGDPTTLASPFPDHVVREHAYRQEILTVNCHFNHLRTMKGIVFRSIPEDQFKWPDTDRWYESGSDYIFMTAGLELAGGRSKFIPEILCLYNQANPVADHVTRSAESTSCSLDYLHRPALAPLEVG